MKRNIRRTLNISADRAAHALRALIADGKIAAKDVTDALRRRERMIRDLRQRLDALEHGAVPATRGAAKEIVRRATRKPKRRMTPARRAALKLHGRYLGHVRPLSKADRAKVKAVREAKGVHAGIKAAKTMAK